MTIPPKRRGFADLGLLFSESYQRLRSMRTSWRIGGGIAAAVLLAAVAAFFLLDRVPLASGDLASAHAHLGDDCGACHQAFSDIPDANCNSCHEKYGDDLGVFSFAAHYLYRTEDYERVVPRDGELACSECHIEHQGRDAELVSVTDANCAGCHFSSFERDHPQFAALDAEEADVGLLFPHTRHVRDVLDQIGSSDPERACLFCHVPEASGHGFEPLSFDGACANCHLGPYDATPQLPIASGSRPGVELLSSLRESDAPELAWAKTASDRELSREGSSVTKTRLHHPDPWILANLRQLRQRIYPDAGLADILTTSPERSPEKLRSAYEEILATLEEQAAVLRGRTEPFIQRVLPGIEASAREIRAALLDPRTQLDPTELLLALSEPDPALSESERAAIEAVAETLTEPCRQCHTTTKLTIDPVEQDLSTYTSAEFDHSAHVLQARCLECHTEIPILAHLADPDGAEPPAADRATTVNLPGLERCQECHSTEAASVSCTTCHDFHGRKAHRHQLLRYVETAN